MIKILAIAFASLATAAYVGAATPGSDNAANPAYSDGWATGDNGGTGFQAWNLFTTGTDMSNFAGVFIGNSTTLATPGADINTTGASWGMFGTGTAASNA